MENILIRGTRVVFIEDHITVGGKRRAKADDKATILNTGFKENTVSVKLDGKHYPIYEVPISQLKELTDEK